MVENDVSCADKQGFTRREIMETTLLGLGGVATVPLVPTKQAEAAPTDPAGPKVPRNPIAAAIQKGPIEIELVNFCTPPRTSSSTPYALINTLYHMGDGSGRIFANDSRGKLYLINTQGKAALILDLLQIRGSKLIKNSRTTGFRSFAFHPDFHTQGKAGFGKLYTVSTETATDVPPGVEVFKGDFSVDHHDVLVEWTVDPSNLKVNVSSRREILRIAQSGRDHNTDQLMFDPNLKPGDPGHGFMFITVGDGVSTNPGDRYKVAQNLSVLNGKVLRIDPTEQPSKPSNKPYGIPADNPFVGKAGAKGEIWAYGFRHPGFLSFDIKALGGQGTMFIADIGQVNIEEINIGRAGGNFGWSRREGTYVTDTTSEATLYELPNTDDPEMIYPVAQYDHSEGQAICGGYVYRGSAIPELKGKYVFGDIRNGRVFYADVSEMLAAANGETVTIREITLRIGGKVVVLLDMIGAISSPHPRVDLRFGQNDKGEMYLISKQDGNIRKFAKVGIADGTY